MTLRIPIETLAKGTEGVLSGETLGKKVCVRLVQEVSSMPPGTVVLLDFRGITVVTGSFLREAVLRFREYCTSSPNGVRPVVASMSAEVRAEFEYFLTREREAFVMCDLDRNGKPQRARVLGRLDEVQDRTLKLVLEMREVNAAQLARRDKATKATAWNNRLSSLAEKGLLWEENRGRAKYYRPVMEVL